MPQTITSFYGFFWGSKLPFCANLRKMIMECCGPGYASPQDAILAPRENLLYTIAIYTGTGIQKPDYLATIDVDPESRPIQKLFTG